MKICVSVTYIALFLLLQSGAARAQSNFVDVGSNSFRTGHRSGKFPRAPTENCRSTRVECSRIPNS